MAEIFVGAFVAVLFIVLTVTGVQRRISFGRSVQ